MTDLLASKSPPALRIRSRWDNAIQLGSEGQPVSYSGSMDPMRRIVERLERRLTWNLIPPHRSVGDHETGASRGNAGLLERALQLRAGFGLVPEQCESRHSFSAAGSWHLIATDHAGAIAGTVRVYVIDRQNETLEPADIPKISHVSFPSEKVYRQHLEVLRRLFNDKATERFFIAPGGMFTTPAWRGSGLAAALGAAAIAMARLYDSRFSASYTAVLGQAQSLFTTFGGRPPTLRDGKPIAPVRCLRHGFELQLLFFDSSDPGTRAESGVQLMGARLADLIGRRARPA